MGRTNLKKEDVVQLHKILRKSLKKADEELPEKYEEHGVGPSDAHKSKSDHIEAVWILVENFNDKWYGPPEPNYG